MDPPHEVQRHALSPTMVNITWKIPPGYSTVYFVVHVLDYAMRSEFQEVTDSNATHLVIKDLRPYTYYLIYVQLYADRRARGASNTSWVRTFETSEFLRCFSDGTKQNKTKQNKTKQNKTRRELNRTIALPIISGARSGVQKVKPAFC
jgi:hypothetical protein